MKRAVFLDRDGVINHLVLDPRKNEYVAPYSPYDLKLKDSVIESLKTLLGLGYLLFVVSNQPDYATGRTKLENLKSVHEKLHSTLTQNNIHISEYYYCHHHPQGMVPEYSITCECRKPGNLQLRKAKEKYNINMEDSWMIGDRDSDIICGKSSSTKTILIKDKRSEIFRAGQSNPDYEVNNLKEAVEIIKIF